MKPTVTFHQVDPKGGTLTAELGNGVPNINASSGWSNVQRQKQISLTEWQGRDPMSMDIPIMFDGLIHDTSVEQSIKSLYWLMTQEQGPRQEPCVIMVSGPVPYNTYRWVITGIQPGNDADSIVRRASDGQVIRWTGTVTVTQYVPGNVLVIHKPSPAKHSKTSAGRKGGTTRVRYYVVRRGDTLGGIAARLLHKSSRWHDIAKLNGIRDPNKGLKVGQRLKIPA
jgi:hypothetical protein